MVRGLGVNFQFFQKCEHLPVGDTFDPVTLSLKFRTSPYAQPIQMVGTVRDLGLFLNSGFSADDNVAHGTLFVT